MKDLEKYITDNLESFDSKPVPDGSKAHFMTKIRSEKRRSRIISISLAGIAASAAILTGIIIHPDLSRELRKHHMRLAEMENEIMMMIEKSCPEEMESFTNTLRSITSEPISLEEQLPEYLPEKEKSRILNEYYQRKQEALEDIYELFL